MSSESSSHNNNTARKFTPPSKIEELYSKNIAGTILASINAPTSGARIEKELPRGKAAFQLYSFASPNGAKVSLMLEELGIDYDAHPINVRSGEQFQSGFVNINPNAKVPCAIDFDGPNGQVVNLWESASIVLYLAEKYGKFIPKDPLLRTEVMSWVFWQMSGQGPMSGNVAHFFIYAPSEKAEACEYGLARYGMEVQRLTDVLDKHLAKRTYIVGEEYTIADMIVFPWFQTLRNPGFRHSSGVSVGELLSLDKYKNVNSWADRIASRPAAIRALQAFQDGVAKPWLVKK
jgi:GST-like protein